MSAATKPSQVDPAEFYSPDLAYIHHDGFGQLAEQGGVEVLRLVQGHGIRGGTAIDLACGSGIWARQLSDAGFDVHGVDYSSAMVALAQQQAPNASFECASLFDIELPSARLITIMGEGLNYCAAGDPSLDRVEQLFGRIAEALEPGGLFLFDVMVTDAASPLAGTSGRVGEDWAVFSEFKEDVEAQSLERRITVFREVDGAYRRSEEVHNVRVFHPLQLSDLLTRCGFRCETARSYGSYALLPRRMAFIASKKQT